MFFCIYLYLFLFLISRKLKKYVAELFLIILFMIINYPDRYKTQRMCDETADDCLAALKFIPDWFVTRKMLKMVQDALNSNDDILFFDEDFSKVTFFAIKWVFWV